MANNKIIAIENARIIFRNLSGEARKYNKAGDRNFNVVLTKEQADLFTEEGFNVRVRPPRDEDGDPQYLLQVAVSYKVRPPRVVLITRSGKTELNEDTVGEIDFVDLENVDLTIRPYHWSLDTGASGVKAYLNSMFVTLLEDEFDEKYRDIPTR